MSLKTEMQRDIQYGAESDFGCVVRWLDNLFPAVRSSLRKEKQFFEGGAEYQITFSVVIRQNAKAANTGAIFSTLTQPVIGNDILVDGSTFTVVSVDDGHGSFMTLGLHDPNAK